MDKVAEWAFQGGSQDTALSCYPLTQLHVSLIFVWECVQTSTSSPFPLMSHPVDHCSFLLEALSPVPFSINTSRLYECWQFFSKINMILSFLLNHLNWYFIDQSPSHLPIYKTLHKHPQLTLATLHITFTPKTSLHHFHLSSHFSTHYCLNCFMALPKAVCVSTDSTLSSIIISLEEALKFPRQNKVLPSSQNQSTLNVY